MNPAAASFYQGNPDLMGHDEKPKNPTGKAAEDAENEYKKNYRDAIRKLKEEERKRKQQGN